MPSTYRVTIGERTVSVTLRQEGEETLVSVDGGPERPVRLTSVRGALRALRLGDATREVMALRDPAGEGVRVAVGGVNVQAEVVDERRARLAGASGGGSRRHAQGELKAPMPGLVVKVLCAPGDAVQPGQPLVVLQAMKMENELSLPRGGTVKSVSIEPGQTVDQGQLLVAVE